MAQINPIMHLTCMGTDVRQGCASQNVGVNHSERLTDKTESSKEA